MECTHTQKKKKRKKKVAEQEYQFEPCMVTRFDQRKNVSSLKIAHVLMSQRKPITWQKVS